MISIEEIQVGQQIKIFDSFEDSYWSREDYEDWDEDDDNIFGILGKVLTVTGLQDLRLGKDTAIFTAEGYEVFVYDIEYIIGGSGDIPDFNPPDVSDLSGVLFA